MSFGVRTDNPAAVQAEVQRLYLEMFPRGNTAFVPTAFEWITRCFKGGYKNYLPIDARYHDLEHTMQGTLCMARLLYGRHFAGAKPEFREPLVQLGLLGILFHDTGYLRTRQDSSGTGAKYTTIHVDRSAAFAAEFLAEKGFPPAAIRTVQNIIHCTGVEGRIQTIDFQSEAERLLGLALVTSDYLGQMAAEDYVDKLSLLFEEFAEARDFEPDSKGFVAGFATALDLVAKTPGFWDHVVKPKLESDYGGLYRFLNRPYPNGPNTYLEAVERNVQRIRGLLTGSPAPAGG